MTPQAVILSPRDKCVAPSVSKLAVRGLHRIASTDKLNGEKESEIEVSDYLNQAAVRYVGIWFSSAMRGCASCNAAAMTAMEGKANVVFPDGGLLEYARSVTAGSALGKNSTCFFVCNADEMMIEGFVSAVSVSEELCSGQLYFVLPRSMINYPLRAEDLAALAVKASTALIGAAGLCGRRAVTPLFFPVPVDNDDRRWVEKEKQDWQRRSPMNGIKGPKFSPELVAIPD